MTSLGLKRPRCSPIKRPTDKTTLYGTISFPSNFDPGKKYPTLVSGLWRAGRRQQRADREFRTAECDAEYGFLVVSLSSRAVPGMGKRTLDSIYLKLGVTEMDDMAEGIKALWNRVRTSTRHASASTAHPTAATRRHWRFCGIRMYLPPPRHHHRPPPGTTTTRSIPSATCGFRRKIRKVTRPATP